MVNSTLVDVIWHQRDLINVSANILESQIPEHLPVFFHGVLLYSDPINRHLGVIRVDDKRDFRKLQKEIQDFYQKNFASWQVELSEIAPQIYYVAKIGDNYYRCQVCSTKEKAGQFFVLVLLVDFGMFKKVLAQNLFNLNEEFVVGEWETARALCCTLPDDVTMFELKLPNYAVFKTEIEERAPVEVIILSFSNEQPQPCLAVVGSCMPDAFNTLNIDNYFLGKESRLFWMLKYLRGEHELTEIPWNDEITLQGDIHLNYAIQSSELTTDWSNVVLVKSKSADEIFVRTIASSLRLAFMQDLLNEQYSVINIKSMSFEKNQLKLGLPVVALHPDTNRLFRAQINWVSGDHNTVNVIGIDNPTFDFTMNYFQVYQLDQMFLVAPEVEHIALQSAKEIAEAWQHMNELINPGDVIKVQRLPRSNKTRLLFLDKEDKEEKDIVNTLNKLNINASIFKPKSAVHKPEIEIADTKTDNNAVRNDSYKLETVADHMFADGGLDYLTNLKNIYSPPMRKSLNGLDLYNRFDHTKPNIVSPSKHTVIRSPKSVKFNLEKIIVEMSPTQLNGMRPSRLMST